MTEGSAGVKGKNKGQREGRGQGDRRNTVWETRGSQERQREARELCDGHGKGAEGG